MKDNPTAISRPVTPVSPALPRAARDYTRGNLHVNIWLLAWPMVADMLSSSVYQIVDVYWVGKLGSAALAAATLATVIRWVLNSLAMGLGIGGLAVVARRIGEGKALFGFSQGFLSLGPFLLLPAGLLPAGPSPRRPVRRAP